MATPQMPTHLPPFGAHVREEVGHGPQAPTTRIPLRPFRVLAGLSRFAP
jgi:hypothetical protein